MLGVETILVAHQINAARLRRARAFALALQALLARADMRAPDLAAWIAERAPHDFGATPATLADRHICWRMRAYGIESEGDTPRTCALTWAETALNLAREHDVP
jgi:hypothetical protein